jgi:putative ABC transport system permease protein
MGLGIALGVAVVVSIDLANVSAGRAFELSTETITGKATHQITGGPNGLDDRVYVELRRSGLVDAAAPVISATVTSQQLGGGVFQLLGRRLACRIRMRPPPAAARSIKARQRRTFRARRASA